MAGVMNIAALFPLLRLRCTLPLLARLHETQGARVAELISGLGVSRITVKQTLNHAIECGWVKPNPGHGHPLRPEYLLTAAGERLGPACGAVLEAAGNRRDVVLRRWAIPIVLVLEGSPRRFNDMARALRPVTDRALVLALHELQEQKLVLREVGGGAPGEIRYLLGAASGVLVGPVRGLAATAGGSGRKRRVSGVSAVGRSRPRPRRADILKRQARPPA